MAVIAPFCATHYDTQKVPNLADLITPPYDVIPAGEDRRYWEKSPYCFAHLDLPRAKDDDYSRARDLINRWREHGILATDPKPSYYLYRQNYTLDGTSHTRDTLMCAVLLHEFADGVIRPHENTFGQYKADRLLQLQTTKFNLSHIFGMVKDPDGFLEQLYEKWKYQPPLLQTTSDDGNEHVVWRMEHSKVKEIDAFFSERPIYIVDGHHRYESSLAYARELGVLGKKDHPAAYMMFAIANTYDPGLVVLPTHRLVKGVGAAALTQENIKKNYDLEPVTIEKVKEFSQSPTETPRFGLYFGGQLYLASPRNWHNEEATAGRALSMLSVYWSDRKFLAEICDVNDANRSQKIKYEKDIDRAWAQRSECDAIVLHAPPAIETITRIADDKKFMPQKSTFFYPKLFAGLVMRDVSGGK